MEQASSQHENTLIAEPIDWSDVQSLWAAIRSNKPDAVGIISRRCGSQVPNVDGRTALMYAAYLGREECSAKLKLVSNRQDAFAKDNSGRTALHWAAVGGKYYCALSILKLAGFMAADEFILAKDDSGKSALDLAFEHGNFGVLSAMLCCFFDEWLQKFIKEQLRPRLAGNIFGVLSVLAELKRDIGFLKIDFKSEISKVGAHERDWLGRSPLHIAAIFGEADAVSRMLAAGHDPNAIDEGLSTPLIACVRIGGSSSYKVNQEKIVKLLLPVTDVQWSDREGVTALMIAANNGLASIVEMLLPHSDVSARDKKWKSALDHIYIGSSETEESQKIRKQLDALLRPVTNNSRYLVSQLNKDIHGRNFLKAAEEGDVAKLKKMLDAEEKRRANGAEFDSVSGDIETTPLVARIDASESTALMISSRCGHSDCVELLLMHGADPLRRNRYGLSALMLAAVGDADSHGECARLLIPKSYVDAKCNSGDSGLFEAAKHPRSKSFEQLFKVARHDFTNDSGETPLMLAAASGHSIAVELLLPTSNAKARDAKGWSALDHATGGHPEILQMLIDANSDDELLGSAMINLMDEYRSDGDKFIFLIDHGALKSTAVVDGTVLLKVAKHNEPEVMEFLIRYGDCTARDDKGATLLMHAAQHRDGLVAVRMLLGICDPDAVDHEGYTALARAVEARNVNIVRALLRKTDPSIRLPHGKTMLMLAAEADPETIKAVLPVSDAIAVDVFGRDALMWAAQRHPKCVEALLPLSNPHRADNHGSTALMCASYYGSESCVRALLPHSKVKAKDKDGKTAAQVAVSRELSAMINKWKPGREAQGDHAK